MAIRHATRAGSARSSATWGVRLPPQLPRPGPCTNPNAGVDDPGSPPCKRCKRESKKCEFSATRRKRKNSQDDDDGPVDNVLRRDQRRLTSESSYGERSGRAQYPFETPGGSYTMGSASPQQWPGVAAAPGESLQATVSKGYSTSPISGKQPLGPPPLGPSGSIPTQYARQGNEHIINKTAVDLLSPAISNSHDALHLLSEAAGRSEDMNRVANHKSPSTVFDSPSSAGPQLSARGGASSQMMRQGTQTEGGGGPISPHLVDPQIIGQNAPNLMPNLEDSDVQKALKAWSRLRFVRAGWFTNREAMAYIA